MNTPKLKRRADYIWATLATLYVVVFIALDWRFGWAIYSASGYLFFVGGAFFASWLFLRHHWRCSLWLRVAAYTAFLVSIVVRIVTEDRSAWLFVLPAFSFIALLASDIYAVTRKSAASEA